MNANPDLLGSHRRSILSASRHDTWVQFGVLIPLMSAIRGHGDDRRS
jgi:hypothetical protein